MNLHDRPDPPINSDVKNGTKTPGAAESFVLAAVAPPESLAFIPSTTIAAPPENLTLALIPRAPSPKTLAVVGKSPPKRRPPTDGSALVEDLLALADGLAPSPHPKRVKIELAQPQNSARAASTALIPTIPPKILNEVALRNFKRKCEEL
jgi:hypothetical protein